MEQELEHGFYLLAAFKLLHNLFCTFFKVKIKVALRLLSVTYSIFCSKSIANSRKTFRTMSLLISLFFLPLVFLINFMYWICYLQEKRLKEKAARREARKGNAKVRIFFNMFTETLWPWNCNLPFVMTCFFLLHVSPVLPDILHCFAFHFHTSLSVRCVTCRRKLILVSF